MLGSAIIPMDTVCHAEEDTVVCLSEAGFFLSCHQETYFVQVGGGKEFRGIVYPESYPGDDWPKSVNSLCFGSDCFKDRKVTPFRLRGPEIKTVGGM